MEEIFDSGFTKLSFLNLCKEMTREVYNTAIKKSIKTNKKYITKGLNFKYIIDKDVNACAWIENSYDNIYINTGTLLEIYLLFYNAFSNNEVFVNIGNAANENNSDIIGNFNIKTKQLEFNAQPKDEKRLLAAQYVSLFAIRYIISHELGHLLNGHCYLWDEEYNLNKMNMILKKLECKFSNSQELLEKYALDRRCIEMDADSFAATYSMNNILTIYKDRNKYIELFELLDNPYQIFELWTFAVHNIFMLFELTPSCYGKNQLYLPNVAREMLNLLSAQQAMKAFMKEDGYKELIKEKSEIDKYFISGIKIAEKFFNLKYKKNFNYVEEASSSKNFNEYKEEVLNHWDNNLLYRLKGFSRTELFGSDKIE